MGREVNHCPKLRDVIYGRPLKGVQIILQNSFKWIFSSSFQFMMMIFFYFLKLAQNNFKKSRQEKYLCLIYELRKFGWTVLFYLLSMQHCLVWKLQVFSNSQNFLQNWLFWIIDTTLKISKSYLFPSSFENDSKKSAWMRLGLKAISQFYQHILQADFSPISFCQKNPTNLSTKKLHISKASCKMLVK